MIQWLLMWIILLCSWALQNSVLGIPINIGQDPASIATSGYVAARDYPEWKKCLGYACPVKQQEKPYIRLIKCTMGIKEACLNKEPEAEEDVIEQDIFLTLEDVKQITSQVMHNNRKKRMAKYFPNYFISKHRNKRKVTTEVSKQWTLPIHYKLDEDFMTNSTARTAILDAIHHWETQTCIRFKQEELGTVIEGPHVVFTKGKICGSYIGQIPVYPQPVQIDPECAEIGSIAHELGHLVGFWHEHQRTDRDNYVIIHGENARTEREILYSLELKGATANLVPYDYGSLMHYRAWAFTKTGLKTIEPIDKMYVQTLGQKVGLSFLDAKLANIAYCTNVCPTPLPSACLHSGYQDPNACDRCRCPDGLGGTYCNTVAPSKHGNCSEIIHLEKGESRKIFSPGYLTTEPYANNVECNWIVKAPQLHRVLLILDGSIFGVYCEDHVPVCFHWLEIKYHRDFSKTGPRICCHGFPMMTLRSEGSDMILTMRAKYETPPLKRRGFVVTVTTERDCGQNYGRVLKENENPCPPENTTSTNTNSGPDESNPAQDPPKHSPLAAPLSQQENTHSREQNNEPVSPVPSAPPENEPIANQPSSLSNTPASSENIIPAPPKVYDSAIDMPSSVDSDREVDDEPVCIPDLADNTDVTESSQGGVMIKLCTKMDFVILFDETWSPSVSFELVIQFLEDIISLFTIGPLDVQVAFISFGPQSKVLFNFKELDTKDEISEVISTLQSLRGSTNVAAGFKDLEGLLSSPESGHRPGVTTVCLVFLNSGSSMDKEHTIPAANTAREKGAIIFAIGTSWASRSELAAITGDVNKVFFRSTVRILLSDDIAQQLHTAICDIQVKSPITDSLNNIKEDSNIMVGNIWSCDFDTSDGKSTLCGMQQTYAVNQNEWKLWEGSTPSYMTGPSMAHSGRYYMYIEASIQTTLKKAEIFLQSSQGWKGDFCLSFYAHMYGKGIGELQVVMKYSDTVQKTLWQKSGEAGNDWFLVQLDVTLTKCPQIGFVGTITDEYTGDIALDSIDVTAGQCL